MVDILDSFDALNNNPSVFVNGQRTKYQGNLNYLKKFGLDKKYSEILQEQLILIPIILNEKLPVFKDDYYYFAIPENQYVPLSCVYHYLFFKNKGHIIESINFENEIQFRNSFFKSKSEMYKEVMVLGNGLNRILRNTEKKRDTIYSMSRIKVYIQEIMETSVFQNEEERRFVNSVFLSTERDFRLKIMSVPKEYFLKNPKIKNEVFNSTLTIPLNNYHVATKHPLSKIL